jgi:hypothetical protein
MLKRFYHQTLLREQPGFFFAKISRFQFRQHAEVNYPVMGNAVPNPGFRAF